MVSSQYSLNNDPAGVSVTERLLRKKSVSPISLSIRWIVLVRPEGVILHSRALLPKWRDDAKCLKSSSSLIFIEKLIECCRRLLLFQFTFVYETGSECILLDRTFLWLLHNMQYNITIKSLDATGVSQYIKCGLTINQYRLRKIIQIQGDKNGH